jgi:hypothetical protein
MGAWEFVPLEWGLRALVKRDSPLCAAGANPLYQDIIVPALRDCYVHGQDRVRASEMTNQPFLQEFPDAL